MINPVDRTPLITQAEYAKKLRPFLPAEAFSPDFNKVWILLINVAILVCGWIIAIDLDRWNGFYLWLYLPLSIVMGNSIIVLAFSTHDLLHSCSIKNLFLRRVLSLIGFTMLWMPPTLWKVVHNREHHTRTNSLKDPDRSYLHAQPKTWGKRIQHWFAPSSEVHAIGLIIGMGHAWGIHAFRNLTSVLLFNSGSVTYVPAAFKVTSKERRAIGLEFLTIFGVHLSIFVALGFDPLKLVLSYFLPIWIGYSGVMFYIYTNHMLCPMTETNDPLVNSVSLSVPKFFDLLHLNFSYHTEHHIFPGLNSDYYPQVQALLKAHYSERLTVLEIAEAWRLLRQKPQYYKDETTFTDWLGAQSMPCPSIEPSSNNSVQQELEIAVPQIR